MVSLGAAYLTCGKGEAVFQRHQSRSARPRWIFHCPCVHSVQSKTQLFGQARMPTQTVVILRDNNQALCNQTLDTVVSNVVPSKLIISTSIMVLVKG